jgi:Family of unknown function (DUF6527)
MKTKKFESVFQSLLPERLEENKLYVSIDYNTVVHRCACGCGEEVVTPLSPTDWKLTYNGETLTLHPSIGNWSFKCRSHYWIRGNHVVWAEDWSDEKVERVRKEERKQREKGNKGLGKILKRFFT